MFLRKITGEHNKQTRKAKKKDMKYGTEYEMEECHGACPPPPDENRQNSRMFTLHFKKINSSNSQIKLVSYFSIVREQGERISDASFTDQTGLD